jgi:hypothetical protein
LAYADDIDLMARSLKSGEICKKYGIGNKIKRRPYIYAQLKGYNTASGPCNRKLHI